MVCWFARKDSPQNTSQEATMQDFSESNPALQFTAEKAKPASYDSSYECSLDHWLEVYWLVEEEYIFARGADAEIVG
jgi:hypothetical protein